MICDHCGQDTDNGLGFCNFCRTPFPAENTEQFVEDGEMLEPSSLAHTDPKV